MLNSQLSLFTNEQLSVYTHYQLSTLTMFGLITNRTPEDVERWRFLRDKGWANMTDEERSEWISDTPLTKEVAASKGMYTYHDLNRVESAVEILAIRLKSLGYEVPDLSTKTDWTYKDKFGRTDMERYLGNVSTLRECITLKWDTPVVPSITDKFDYIAANNIERTLMDIDEVTTKLTKFWLYAGDIISGEV